VRSISKKLIINYLFISLFVVLVMLGFFVMAITQYYFGGVERILVNSAENTAAFCSRNAPTGDIYIKAKYIFENMDEQESALIEVIDLNGAVVIDNTGAKTSEIVNSIDYVHALNGETGIWQGKNEWGERIIAVSTPIYDNRIIVGALRYVSTLENVYKTTYRILIALALIGVLVFVFALILAVVLAKSITTPIKELIRVTNEITQGNFKVNAFKYNNDEIGQLADAINIMSVEIAKTDQAKNEFISSISHELRTPLTSIKGWTETLQDYSDDPEMLGEGLNIINGETDRLIVLVNDLLDFSRLQAHRLEMKMAEFPLNDLLEDIYVQFSVRAKQENVNLMIDLKDDNVLLMGDYNRLKQVFINLLDNAMKFTVGYTEATIVIASFLADEKVYVSIKDNGSGISPEDLVRVKEKFYKGGSKKSGTGLGLSIATEIVELHGGKLWIESVYGEGTEITVEFPLECDIAEEN